MTRGRKNNKLLTTFLIVLLLVAAMFGGWLTLPAFADTSAGYTGVLEDLQKDSAFNVNDYPRKAGDTSIQVIQIAESTNGELFVYVYQPAADSLKLTATSINISTAINDNLKYQNYELTQIDTSGVLAKYKVENFTVKKDTVRYYDISSIFRPWNSAIDKVSNANNTIQGVSYAVAQQWTACTVDGVVSYSCIALETITITDKYCGYVRYFEGTTLFVYKCDSWYVAFSTDKPIDKLVEADVSYVSQPYTYMDVFGATYGYEYGEKVNKSITLKYTDCVTTDKVGFFGHSYSWDRIEKVSDFVAREELTDSALNNLTNKQWVLRFVETDYKFANPKVYATLISEVTILRLKFETNGVSYNLGVVDNKQSIAPDQKPDNYPSDDDIFEAIKRFFIELWTKIKAFFKTLPPWAWLLIAAVVLLLFMPLLSLIFPAVGSILVSILKGALYVLKTVLKGLLWFLKSFVAGAVFLVTLPFKGIAALIRKIRSGKKK